MIEDAQITATLTEFIQTEIVSNPNGATLRAEDNLLENSIVDSLRIMRLVVFIEQKFGFAVPPQDVTIENFITAQAIADYLKPHLSDHAD